MLAFPRWEPDAYHLASNILVVAKNVLPVPDGYTPWPAPAPISDALPNPARGALTVRKTDASTAVIVGTFNKLYRSSGAVAFADVSRAVGGAYGLPEDEQWSLAQYGNRCIAAQASDDVQYIDVESGTNFAALPGTPPRARIVRVVGDFVMLGGLVDFPNRVHWSGRNNSDFWTIGTQDCDKQDFADGGFVNGIATFGQNRGLVFQQTMIRVFGATNDRSIFTFQKIEESRGLIAPDSLVVVGPASYYLSEEGFCATDASGQTKPIGVDRVDGWFHQNVNYSRIYAVRGTADPTHGRVMWMFPSVGNETDILDLCICYDISTDCFTYGEFGASTIFPGAQVGWSIDDIGTLLTSLGYTLETAPFSFDARFLTGGAPFLAIFGADNRLAFLSGGPLEAIIQTSAQNLIPGMRTFVRGVRPIIDGVEPGEVNIEVCTMATAQEMMNFGAPSPLNEFGICPLRANSRYHCFRMTVDANTAWTHTRGLSFDEETPIGILFGPAGLR